MTTTSEPWEGRQDDYAYERRRARLEKQQAENWRDEHPVLVQATLLTLAVLFLVGVWGGVVVVGEFMWRVTH